MTTLIIGLVAVISIVFVVNINSSRKTLEELNEDKGRLEEKYNDQLKLAEELEEKEVYVKTNAYIEEQARKIGLVYPDEVIFKPED